MWWDNSKGAELAQQYHLLFASSHTYEAYLFALICKTEGRAKLLGSATTEKEAIDLIKESGKERLLCLLSDDIAPDCGARVAELAAESNTESRAILIVNDPEKFQLLPNHGRAFSAACASASVGRGGLQRCLERINHGECNYIEPVLNQALTELAEHGATELNLRERDILGYVAKGLTNKEIAKKIFIAEKTVRDYVSSAFAKLGVSNRAGAAAWAIRHGMVSE